MENGIRLLVKPVQRESVQRRHLTPVRVWDPNAKKMVDTGQASGKLKARDASESIGFVVDAKTGRFKTGLDELVTNPFLGFDPLEITGKYNLSEAWSKLLPEILRKDEITRQIWYEILDGVDPDFYTSKVPAELRTGRVVRMNFDNPRTFIETFSIELSDGTNSFHSSTSRGRIAIQLLKNHPIVAPSLNVANPNYHNWYIAEENEEEMYRAKADQLENEAIVRYYNVTTNYPYDRVLQLGAVLDLFNNPDIPKAVMEDKFNRYIKAKGSAKERNISKFNKYVTMMEENYKIFIATYAVKQGLYTNMLRIDGGFVYWLSKVNEAQVYRWKSEEQLINYLATEMDTYNPEEQNSTNYFAQFARELRARGVEIKH